MAVSSSAFLQLNTFKNVVKSRNITLHLLNRLTNRLNNVSLYSTASTVPSATNETKPIEEPPKKISKAMLAYLERAQAHDKFIQQEQKDYNLGKRHLANMMGEDPEHFTQEDVNRSIEYLFPSGLFDKAARPVMKPPEEMFPPRKAAQFDESGRPFHYLFYTTRPHYYEALHNIYENMLILNDLQDKMIRKGVPPDQSVAQELHSSEYVSHLQMEKILLEKIKDTEYEYFISSIKQLADHPYANHVKDFIMKYKQEKRTLADTLQASKLEYDKDERPFITVRDCMRKDARGTVTIKGKGTGKIMINGKTLINYFPTNTQSREQVC